MTTDLLQVPILELLSLWEELVEAYYCVNGYGGDTAEIYAYRLIPYSPIAHIDPRSATAQKAQQKLYIEAAQKLVALIYLFQEMHECSIVINGMIPDGWITTVNRGHITFDHWVHVRVVVVEGK